jgi:hypothetical protein
LDKPAADLDDRASVLVHWRSGFAPNPTHIVFLDRKGGGTTIAHLDMEGFMAAAKSNMAPPAEKAMTLPSRHGWKRQAAKVWP